jgi:hypothetical protein
LQDLIVSSTPALLSIKEQGSDVLVRVELEITYPSPIGGDRGGQGLLLAAELISALAVVHADIDIDIHIDE